MPRPHPLFLLCAAAAALLLLADAECYTGCDFRPCNGKTEFAFRGNHPDVALTGGICPKFGNIRVGKIFGTGEAVYVDKRNGIKFVPISQWRPAGLNPLLARSFFKTYEEFEPFWRQEYVTRYRQVTRNDDDDDDRPAKKWEAYQAKFYAKRWRQTGRSGVGHQSYNGNQLRYINRRCFVLPIRVYEQINWKGHPVRNIWTNKGRDCVAFFVKNW